MQILRGAGLVSLMLLVATGLVLAGGARETAPAQSNVIGISKIVAHPALDAVEQGIIDELRERGFTNLTFDVQNANGDMSTASSIANKFRTDRVRLAVGIATPTAQALANAISDIPVVFAAVTNPVEAGLVESFDAGSGNITGSSDLTPVDAQFALMREVLSAMGRDHSALDLIETDDPDVLEDRLYAGAPAVPSRERSSFLPPEDKRGLLTTAMIELTRTAPEPATHIPLQAGAPFGAVVLDAQACTLCLACAGACPTNALSDNPDQPMLRFTESACVQCGICAATCPEDAITLVAQIDFLAWEAPRRILKEEEPFHCTVCDKPFGTQSSIERVQERLAGHWMFSGEGEQRRRVLTMCEDCRVVAVVNEGFDPHEGLPTRRVRTADDYAATGRQPYKQ